MGPSRRYNKSERERTLYVHAYFIPILLDDPHYLQWQ